MYNEDYKIKMLIKKKEYEIGKVYFFYFTKHLKIVFVYLTILAIFYKL